MQIEFRLPSLGADMEGATLTQWLKKPGEPVRRGEAIAVVETDKGLIDVESFDDGIVADFIVQPGTKVPVGTVLAHLTTEAATAAAAGITAPPPMPTGAAPRAGQAPPGAGAAPAMHVPAPAVLPAEPAARAGGARARISPAARRRAHELGLSIEALEQQAPSGIVHIEDVERMAARAKAPAPPVAHAPAPAAADARAAMRAAIGNAMARSKREIPHYYLGHTCDFGAARAWMLRHNAEAAVADRLIEGVLIAKAVALAAARIEGFNGYFRDGRFEPVKAVHVGTAIAVRGGGLVAPALLDADRKDLRTLMREFSDLVGRVRAGHMRSGEFTAATITVTSLGEEGVEALYPIINPPQVAIIGTGCITERPWVHDGVVAPRPLLTLALAGDHRVTDGRVGSRFVRAIAELLAAPEKL